MGQGRIPNFVFYFEHCLAKRVGLQFFTCTRGVKTARCLGNWEYAGIHICKEEPSCQPPLENCLKGIVQVFLLQDRWQLHQGPFASAAAIPALGLSTEQELQHKAQISVQRGTAEVPSLRESFKTSWNNFMG